VHPLIKTAELRREKSIKKREKSKNKHFYGFSRYLLIKL